MIYFFLLWFSLSFFPLFCGKMNTKKNFNVSPKHPEPNVTPPVPDVSAHAESPENLLASWTMISSPQAALQNLKQSPLLTIQNWKTQSLSNFQHIEAFKQAQSLEEVKKIILKKLLEQRVNLSLVAEFLVRAELPEGWCGVLQEIIQPLWNTKTTTNGMSIADIRSLLAVPLSSIQCDNLKLPVPNAFQEAFENADEARLDQHYPSCLKESTQNELEPQPSISNQPKEQKENSLANTVNKEPRFGSIRNSPEQAAVSASDSLRYTNTTLGRESFYPKTQKNENEYHSTSAESTDSLSYEDASSASQNKVYYVQGISCLEFWITVMIEQSIYYHKKRPDSWNSIFNSAHQDPMNQRIVQHLKKNLFYTQENPHSAEDQNFIQQRHGSGGAPSVISASSSGSQNSSSKPFTDGGYLEFKDDQQATDGSSAAVPSRVTKTFWDNFKRPPKK